MPNDDADIDGVTVVDGLGSAGVHARRSPHAMSATVTWGAVSRHGATSSAAARTGGTVVDGDLNADVVLEGGGVKGIGLVGALSVLMDAGYTFPRIAGTSAGAIVGALLASDTPPARMRSIMASTDYRLFQDESWLDKLPGGKLISLLVDDGIYEGEYFKSWLDEMLGDVDTFDRLALPEDPDSSLPPGQRYRLVVNVSDVSLGRLVRFPWDYQRVYGLEPGQQRIADAVRASMSIPFFFEPVHLEYERTQAGSTKTARSVLVDGGMLSNFPIDIFDRRDGGTPRWPTFGIKLSSRPGRSPRRSRRRSTVRSTLPRR